MSRSAALLLTALAAWSCTGDDALGQVDVALVGRAPSGISYRLRDAVLTVDGPGGTRTFRSEDDPDRTRIRAELESGPYTLGLAPGWRLERLLPDGGAQRVAAELTTPDPMTFQVTGGGSTPVNLQFRAGGDDVGLGQGEVDIGIGVDDAVDAGVVDAPPPDAAPSNRIVVPRTLAIAEGGQASFTIRLVAPPGGGLLPVGLVASDPSLTIEPSRVVFTEADWQQPRSVTVTASHDDDLVDGAAVVHVVPEANLPYADVAVTVDDDDVQGLKLSPFELAVTEGQSQTVDVRLAFQPASAAEVVFSSSDDARISVDPPAITFTPETWSTPRQVTVVASVDADLDPQSVTVTASSAGASRARLPIIVREPREVAFGWPTFFGQYRQTSTNLVMFPIQIPSPGVTINRLQFFGDGTGDRVQLYLYGDQDNAPGRLIASTGGGLIAPAPAPTVLNLPSEQVLTPGTYWIGFWPEREPRVGYARPAQAVSRVCRYTMRDNRWPSFPPVGPADFWCTHQGEVMNVAALGVLP